MECLDEEQRDQVRKMYPNMKLDGLSAPYLLGLIPDPEPLNRHTMVAPLTEIISIVIRFVVNHDVQRKIYGTIQVTDCEGNTFHFYNRDENNPETISNGGTLTLTFPKNNIIIPSNAIQVNVNLKDADNNDEIVKGVFNWNCMMKAGYDEINTVEFEGKSGSVYLDYVTFFHAVIACVDMMLLRRKGDDSESNNVKMYGEIIARHVPLPRVFTSSTSSSHALPINGSISRNFSCILFNKKRDESVLQEYGTCIQLSRNVLIVPSLSSLEIYVKLFNGETHQQIVEGKIEFDALTIISSQESVEGQSDILRVQYKRSHPYMQPPMHFLERPSSTMTINRNLRSPYGFKLYEIYSVSIGGVNDEDINLCGSIIVSYLDSPRFCLSLFNKDKDSSHRLLPYHTVPLTSYTQCISWPSFCMGATLRDANGHVISSGFMSWSEIHFEEYWSLFNRQLCSIIRGNDGCYAAIHYSIFDAGVQAVVQIYLNKKTLAAKHVKIDGSICSQYSCYDYSILYNKEYYRRQLFTRKSSESWIHCPDSSVMLSESSVMVPKGSSLILDVNLEVTSKGVNLDDDVDISDCISQVGDSFKELLEFEVDMNNSETTMKEIEGSSHIISVHVEWRQVLY